MSVGIERKIALYEGVDMTFSLKAINCESTEELKINSIFQ